MRRGPGRRVPDQRCHVDDTVIEMHSWTLAPPAGRPPPDRRSFDGAAAPAHCRARRWAVGSGICVVLGSPVDRTSGQSGAGRGLEEGLRFHPGAGSGARRSWASLKLNRSLVRFASSHPVRHSVASAVLIAPWIGFLFRHIVHGLLAGLVMFAVQRTLWVLGEPCGNTASANLRTTPSRDRRSAHGSRARDRAVGAIPVAA